MSHGAVRRQSQEAYCFHRTLVNKLILVVCFDNTGTIGSLHRQIASAASSKATCARGRDILLAIGSTQAACDISKLISNNNTLITLTED